MIRPVKKNRGSEREPVPSGGILLIHRLPDQFRIMRHILKEELIMFVLRPYHNNQLWNPFADMERMMNSDFFSSRDLAAFKTDITDEGDHYEL